MIDQPCAICGNGVKKDTDNGYLRCTRCGHESLETSDEQGFIINDSLTMRDVKKITSLDKYKSNVLKSCCPRDINSGGVLLDIGSASGKFLYHNSHDFSDAYGLEITPECVEFSKTVLEIKVIEDVSEVPSTIQAVTAWHSLEHIPATALRSILEVVTKSMDKDGVFIVSVPNADSKQYRWFTKSFAYYDNPHHLHQFSNRSLDCLFEQFGLERSITFDTGPYNRFGYIQAILNKLVGGHNYLYYRLKRKSGISNYKSDLLNFTLLPFALLIGGLLSLFDMNDKKNQGVITACYKKKSY
ncbi:class I SAM-dependent methyltransferase [Neptuniibacter sp. SY11_33]|uniref:class I SAM-dependent methyltransferase n=1 Tax=Neptuniibacter sp. SY11_33 TaxID=3398215 RepID=UPI0039F64508